MVKKMVRNNSQGPELGPCGSFYNELTKAQGRYVTEPNLKMLLFYSGTCLRWFRAFLGFSPHWKFLLTMQSHVTVLMQSFFGSSC